MYVLAVICLGYLASWNLDDPFPLDDGEESVFPEPVRIRRRLSNRMLHVEKLSPPVKRFKNPAVEGIQLQVIPTHISTREISNVGYTQYVQSFVCALRRVLYTIASVEAIHALLK
jgi:hypothetical protein